MPITHAALDSVDARYREILALTPHATALLTTLDRADPLRRQYAEQAFVTVEDVLPAEAFTSLVTSLVPILTPVAQRVAMPHATRADGTLSDGLRFARVDSECTHDRPTGQKVARLLRSLGLEGFGCALAERLTPLVRHIVGPASFRRVYVYVYREGDYISVHDDHQVGHRVDVQFPVALGTVSGVRTLADGYLRMHYDKAGTMNVLGPCMWHDVPPVLRVMPTVDPVRVNIGLRFTLDQ